MCEDIRKIEEEKLIVIVRGVEAEKLIPMTQAMYDGGIRLLEITFDASGKVSDEETAEHIHTLCTHFGNKLLFGAGTVLTKKQVALTAQAGGKFIISPDTNAEVIRFTKEQGLVSMPGALTPTEIQFAHTCGADFVKLFPVSTFGPAYLKAVKAPLSHIRLMAVGGVDDKNMGDYAKAGACGFGIGSNIIDKTMLKNNDYAGITGLSKKYVEAVKRVYLH